MIGTSTPSANALRKVDRSLDRLDTWFGRLAAAFLAIAALGIGFALGGASVDPHPETVFADSVTDEYPQLERLDALLYGWMVCDTLGSGWTEREAADWLANAPAEFYGIDSDPAAFGRFIVASAVPMCP